MCQGKLLLSAQRCVALQSGQKKDKPMGRRASSRALAREAKRTRQLTKLSTASDSIQPRPAPAPIVMLAAHPSSETTKAVHDLGGRSSNGLNPQQQQEVKCLLNEYTDIFAAKDEDCTQTGLVQHAIETGSAQPIRLRHHRLSLWQRTGFVRWLQLKQGPA
ncbi:hypothetical protein UPYG_G00193550 [Umbra pygmaea]|uniref:Uncharacterized protein n=1 Tax=Umbra pygmaea TaxID=75934 RepID=A0ABD0X4H7_UMBPY